MNTSSDQAARARKLLLEKLMAKEGITPGSRTIEPRPENGNPPPLSFAQERLWFLQKLDPSSTAYNLGYRVNFDRPVDTETIQKTLDEVARRHEVMRTTYAEEEGKPVQLIAEEGHWPLEFVDCSELGEEATDEKLTEIGEREATTPFVLSDGPPIRGTLVRLAPDRTTLLLSMHHIVIDGWSLPRLFEELDTIYEAFSAGKPSPFPELPVQYADFAIWQRDFLRGPELDRQLTYWRRHLADLPTLEMPTDHSRPVVPSPIGSAKGITIKDETLPRLRHLSQAEGATLFMTILAAFNALLFRYTGQEDIAVGAPFANRNRPEIEDLLGFFVNTLVLRNTLDGNPTFRELLGRVRATTLEALDHQDLPFEKLVEDLAPERSAGLNPLVQILFSFQDLSSSDLGFGESSGDTAGGMSVEKPRVDLEVNVNPQDSSLGVGFTFSTDLFEPTTMERMLEHFRVLLTSVAADPDLRIGDLDLRTPKEAEEQRGWMGGAADYPSDRTIAGLFEDQVEETPNAVAVVLGDESITYRELNEKANQLAHWLRARGVGPEVTVGLCVRRSFEMVAGVLGILKAGGAYVPLDPEYPTSRLTFMLEDAATPVLLSQRAFMDRFAGYEGTILLLDEAPSDLAGAPTEDPTPTGGPESLAYVMYTSGSTGQPKGVCVENRAVARLVINNNFVELGPDEVFLQFAPMSFDAATLELWGSLLHGAKLALCPPGELSLSELGGLIQQHRVTVMWLTGAVFHQMVESHLESLLGIRCLLAGGEALSVSHVNRVLARLEPGHTLVNGYGPTENTTFTTCHVMKQGDSVSGSVPIGRPIANTHIRILDEGLSPVPTGVRGELFIGGDGLARGYLNRPELDAERFIPDPHSSLEGARLYRTGDIVRFLPDGAVEFIGRIDDQVKLRGFRIELGEVRAALVDHPGVRDAVAVVREDTPGDKRLIAYLVPDAPVGGERPMAREAGEEPDAPEMELVTPVRRALAERLPRFMIPAAYVLLEAIPVTPNGKVDFRALPRPKGVRQIEREFEPPESDTELRLAEIWMDVLQISKVGRRDGFFELGGHSLLATQVMSRIRDTFGYEVHLRVIFESPTLAGLAERIDIAKQAADPDAPILAPTTRTRRVRRSL